MIKSASMCHAINSSDSAPVLIVLNASAVLASSQGEREVPMAEFYNNDGVDHTVMQPGEFLARVIVPPAARCMCAMDTSACLGAHAVTHSGHSQCVTRSAAHHLWSVSTSLSRRSECGAQLGARRVVARRS